MKTLIISLLFAATTLTGSFAQTPDALKVKTFTLSKGMTIDSLSPETLKAFWSKEIEGKKPVWVIVGDKKKTDMEGLSRYGEIRELKVKDIIK